MIPKFPEFKKLELSDEKDIKKYTSKFLPYSDFNFTDLWIWNSKNEVLVSLLNENLVVCFTDYITNERFFSFLGNNKIKDTIENLLIILKNKKLKPVLRLIPDELINTELQYIFDIKPDRDSFDYIYDVSRLSNMHKWAQSSSGKNVRNYIRDHESYLVNYCRVCEVSKKEYLDFFKRWAENKRIKEYIKLNEYKALERMFEMQNNHAMIVSLYKNNVLVGFNIHEIVSSEYAISCFAKIDVNHRAIGDILNWEEAKILNNLGVRYFNWEQDLGILNLRKSKGKYKPDFLLKKVSIAYK